MIVAERLDHVVAAKESVVVVVALEGVDVGIEDREPFVCLQALVDLAQDVGVPAHAGQRVQVARVGRPADHCAEARDELFGDERLGHVVVGARQQVLDLVLERAAHGQEDDRDQPRAEVLADLGQDLVAGRRAEHEVEQDDVGPPVDGRLVRGLSVADRHALEAGALEHALDQAQHLLVVVDHEHELADGSRRRCSPRSWPCRACG